MEAKRRGRLRFAAIGCGRMGLRRIRTILDHPDTELACVADSDAERAREVAGQVGRDFTTIDEALSRTDVDCVVASVPNKFHPSTVIPALDHGKHVWCEKPLARNPQEAGDIVNAAVRNSRFLKIGSNLRYFPNVLKAKQLLDDRAIGDILFLRGWIGNAGWQLNSWYSDPDMIGGGTFLDNGAHLLDIYRWFMGEPAECTGYVSTACWPIGSLEDNGMGVFRFASGALASLHSSWTEWNEYMYLEVYGKLGYLRVDGRQPHCLTILGRRNGQQDVFDFSNQPPQSYQLEFDDFVRAVQTNRQPLPSGFDGLRAVQMAYGIYESSRSGRSIPVWGRDEERLLNAYQKIAAGS